MPTSLRYPQTVNHPSSTAPAAKLARVIGENVRRRREAVHLDMNDAAAALHMGCTDFKAREQGIQRFTPGEIAALCELLRVLPSALFSEEVQDTPLANRVLNNQSS